jgi:trehalose 6-phosphate phosphatase
VTAGGGSDKEATAALRAFDLRKIALLLDVDGTLLDIAPRPEAVIVSDDLRATLARLLAATGGALALVSGRPVADLDRLFAPLTLPAIGGHGAEMRVRPDGLTEAISPLPGELRRMLVQAHELDAGVLVEDKAYSVALHYRSAQGARNRLAQYITATIARFPAEATEVLTGKAVFEVKRAGIDKGAAVRKLMSCEPFAGRKPVFAGDDVTDDSVFAILSELGGAGFSVQRAAAGLAGIFNSPDAFRQALTFLAAQS